MNSELSRKIIVASGMAVVVGIIAVTFALRSHHSTSVAKGVNGVKSVDELAMPSAASRTATDTQESATSNEPADSDSRITTELKSQFAADSISKDVDIGVTTTQGVVVLTGTLGTQDAIDHVKNVAENVTDVKSVDTSAMKITST